MIRLGGPSRVTRPAVTLVWVDSREAIVVRRVGDEARFATITSDVPARRRATGHVRHDPNVRHGGGAPQAAGEPRRLEHLARFLATVARRLPIDEDLVLIGPGSAHEQLRRVVEHRDAEHQKRRRIHVARAARLTRPQLAARLDVAMGRRQRRQTVGAYRWRHQGDVATPRRHVVAPRRVVVKRSARPIEVLEEG